MGQIYKISNNINDKVYIGKTQRSFQIRWKEHCSNSFKKDNIKLYNAMKKYGVNNFFIELIEECDDNIINEREIYWINFYDSYYKGYNSTLGGDGYILTDEKNIMLLWEKGYDIKSIEKKLNTTHYAITSVLNKNKISVFERTQRAHKNEGKQIVALDKETLQPLFLYSSQSEAARCLGLKSCARFSRILGDYTKTSKGFCWDLASKFPKEKILNLSIDHKI